MAKKKCQRSSRRELYEHAAAVAAAIHREAGRLYGPARQSGDLEVAALLLAIQLNSHMMYLRAEIQLKGLQADGKAKTAKRRTS